KQPNQALARPYFHRLRTNVLKLAVICEVSRSCTLVVSPDSMARAIDIAGRVEAAIFEMLPTGMSQEGGEIDKIARSIHEGGANGVSRSEVTRAFHSMKSRDRFDRIRTLKEGEVISEFQRPTSGRRAVIYVHKDFYDAHRTQFPKDLEQNE